jgi:AbrB family looped-hinge helix DNA binding protein
MTKATISTKGQIVIPKPVRQRLNLRAGTEVVFQVQGEALVMRRAVRDFPDWRTMRGMARGGPSLTKALLEDRAAEKAHDHARGKSR